MAEMNTISDGALQRVAIVIADMVDAEFEISFQCHDSDGNRKEVTIASENYDAEYMRDRRAKEKGDG